MKLELETMDMYNENYKNLYECEKIVSPKGVNYKYISEDSIENDIYFLDTKVLMARKGEISTKQVYDLKNITKSIYKTPYLITEFEIKTLKIEKINKGYLLEYELYSNGSLMNKIIARFNEK